jgi:hypothetical protein
MGLASDFRRIAATVTPVYCNPFFHRCNSFFQKKQYFLKNFSDRGGKQAKNGPCGVPKPSEGALQEFSEGQFPCNSADQQAHGAAQSDIPPADEKAEPQPRPYGAGNEDGIGEIGHLPPQWPQKSVQQPQS